MKNIGKYNGISCFTCSKSEWYNAHKTGRDDGRQIFIIDGTMVQNNKIIGYYDGNHVRDVYDAKPYHIEVKMDNHDVMNMGKTAEKPVKVAYEETYTVSSTTGATYEEVVAQEIVFSDYSKIVDDFFATLGK